MQLHASGVQAPIPGPKCRGPRGVQVEVCGAADALLACGLKPTIERVPALGEAGSRPFEDDVLYFDELPA